MPPVNPDTSSPPRSRLARRLFWTFLPLSLAPLAALLALAYVFLGAGIAAQPPYLQWRWLISAALLAAAAGVLIWLAARSIGRRPAELLHHLRLFLHGNWEERGDARGSDELARLAEAFNLLADNLSESHHLLMIRDEADKSGHQAAAALLAQGALAAGSRADLLRAALDLFVHHFGCTFGAVYLLEGGQAAGSAFLNLVQTAGTLSGGSEGESIWPPLAERFEQKTINLDATPTMDWLVGKAIATRRPQVGPATPDSYVYEAVLPLTVAGANGMRVTGVVDLLTSSRVKDARLGPFSIRAVSEMQTAAYVLALAIAAFEPQAAPDEPQPAAADETSTRRPLQLSAQTVYTLSTRIAQAQTGDQVLEAVRQAMRTVTYASVALARPSQPAEDSIMQVVICRQMRTQPPGMNEPPLVLPGPRWFECETFFRENSGSPLLLYDLDQPGTRMGQTAPPELEAIARRMGCRSAAFLPAIQDGRLTAILMVGAPPDVPAPLFRSETLQPFSNLIGLAASAIERIQAQHVTHRKLMEMESLWQFTQTVSLETDLNRLFSSLHQQAIHVMGNMQSFAVALYDLTSDTIRIPYMHEDGRLLNVPAFPRGEGLTSEVLHSQRPLLLRNRAEVEAKGRELGMRTIGEAPVSWLGVPILFAGEILGVIFVQDTRQEGRFSEDDQHLLGTLASQVGVVVRNARLLEISRRQAQQERLVNEISDRIRRAADMQSILKTTADELGQALGLRRAEIQITPHLETIAAAQARVDEQAEGQA